LNAQATRLSRRAYRPTQFYRSGADAPLARANALPAELELLPLRFPTSDRSRTFLPLFAADRAPATPPAAPRLADTLRTVPR